MVFVIGLGGVTSSGKTTMCQELLEYLSKQYNNIRVIDLDSYARDENDSNHVDRFISNVKSVINDKNNSILIIEGFIIYSIEELKSIYNLSYYFDLNFDECRKRRNQRIYNPPDPPNYFDRHIWPMYLIAKKHAFDHMENLIHIDSTQPFQDIFHRIVNDMNKELKD